MKKHTLIFILAVIAISCSQISDKYQCLSGVKTDIAEQPNNYSIVFQTVHSLHIYILGMGNNHPHGSTVPLYSNDFNIYVVSFLTA